MALARQRAPLVWTVSRMVMRQVCVPFVVFVSPFAVVINIGLWLGVDCGGSRCPACPTCTDGRLNGNEVGVDCGGSCPPCVSCRDGIKNGNETGLKALFRLV